MELLTWGFLILILAFSQFLGILLYQSFIRFCNRIKRGFLEMVKKQQAKLAAQAQVSVEPDAVIDDVVIKVV